MVEMERTEWSDLRQESPNKIEAPDTPDRRKKKKKKKKKKGERKR